jgi:hypothetical protein
MGATGPALITNTVVANKARKRIGIKNFKVVSNNLYLPIIKIILLSTNNPTAIVVNETPFIPKRLIKSPAVIEQSAAGLAILVAKVIKA